MHRNLVVLVNEQDERIGVMDKLLAHEQGLLHRAFSVFIIRHYQGERQLLMQQRAACKYHCPLLWSNSCCSHPQPDDELVVSAMNRVEEELGFTLDKLSWIGSHTYRAVLSNQLIEHEFDHLFIAQANPDISCFNRDEVESVRWQSLTEIERQLKENPEYFTPWFAPTYHKVKQVLAVQ